MFINMTTALLEYLVLNLAYNAGIISWCLISKICIHNTFFFGGTVRLVEGGGTGSVAEGFEVFKGVGW